LFKKYSGIINFAILLTKYPFNNKKIIYKFLVLIKFIKKNSQKKKTKQNKTKYTKQNLFKNPQN